MRDLASDNNKIRLKEANIVFFKKIKKLTRVCRCALYAVAVF